MREETHPRLNLHCSLVLVKEWFFLHVMLVSCVRVGKRNDGRYRPITINHIAGGQRWALVGTPSQRPDDRACQLNRKK